MVKYKNDSTHFSKFVGVGCRVKSIE